ncbi:formate/nitrite transporter family protein [Bacillus sp. AFS041924]|uniref:formate/nitrite transporter family protein n=1 Tax=Bacillus sp. AFS041924 TaxID=2033503 RepID=UPI000BFCC494|nr:formate/nitrite transporter family protein [Bacillus sp. AFS041924]PGS50648.1 nitrite transporter NirC [Bacillus sp. AFS041924]
MKEVINTIGNVAKVKTNQVTDSKSKYMVPTMMAGFFVGLGIILIFTIGGLLSPTAFAGTKIIMGVSFGIALSLVIMAGADLFTGNNMIMTIGMLEKKVSWTDTFKVWGFSYLGNLIGSILVAILFAYSGLANGGVADFINNAAATKMNAPFMELLIRGILCNILVCLALWCSFKMKSESGKLIMVFWCLFAFITSGFEHSVANMTLLSISLFIKHPETVTLAGMVSNLLPVTIGNIIGGALFVGAAYWVSGSEAKNKKFSTANMKDKQQAS